MSAAAGHRAGTNIAAKAPIKMKKSLYLWIFGIAAAGTMFTQSPMRRDSGGSMTGICSYYARSYEGRHTASGKRFSNRAMTAAHRTLPIGTRLKLTNLSNNRSVVVTVTDRGPFVEGREISVTRRAAQELGFVKQGLARVRIEQVQ